MTITYLDLAGYISLDNSFSIKYLFSIMNADWRFWLIKHGLWLRGSECVITYTFNSEITWDYWSPTSTCKNSLYTFNYVYFLWQEAHSFKNIHSLSESSVKKWAVIFLYHFYFCSLKWYRISSILLTCENFQIS